MRLRSPRAAADPALAAYLNEQLARVSALLDQLRRVSRDPGLAAERAVLGDLRRQVTADRATVRLAMRRLGAPHDWAVLGVGWASTRAARLLPLLHRMPVLDRIPSVPSGRQDAVQVLLELEDLLAGLHRRQVAARVLADAVDAGAGPDGDWALAVRALPARAEQQLRAAEELHRRRAAALLPRPAR
ncbi:hypothetical protein MN205_04820 [Kineococcus sp. TRM81007]|uniref:hypothetical protein n=1 Tax=Kineococcus sp. TRM81007 TaxID=2925831 RepID=UPI001F598224|nr:hypothetical protein [Kineococcus sp. TRM81007]MCI2237811.1 hypothetical protein [Kineococcus sp. TRM81007]